MIAVNEQKQAQSILQTAGDCLRWAETVMRREQVFLGHGTDNYHDEALSLLLAVLHFPWDADPGVLSARMLPLEVEQFVELVIKRVNKRVPAPYLTGTAWFCGMPFKVDERVLIPRSPVAELIEQGFAPWLDAEQFHRVLDLCTGSGCIGIACAQALPFAQVDVSDISEDALAVCRDNVRMHELEEQVSVIHSDGFDQINETYDLIISNPPYVGEDEMASLPGEYNREPAMALASGVDGLDFTRRILRQAPAFLNEQGALIVEVGNTCEQVEQTWPDVPFLWFEFERGGHGVFMLTREQLLEYAQQFA